MKPGARLHIRTEPDCPSPCYLFPCKGIHTFPLSNCRFLTPVRSLESESPGRRLLTKHWQLCSTGAVPGKLWKAHLPVKFRHLAKVQLTSFLRSLDQLPVLQQSESETEGNLISNCIKYFFLRRRRRKKKPFGSQATPSHLLILSRCCRRIFFLMEWLISLQLN